MTFKRILSRFKVSLGLPSRNIRQQADGAKADTIGFAGNYADWEAALADSTGYDSNIILQKTRDAALKVKKGEAPFERDSVVFDRVEYSFPVLAALLRAGVENSGCLSVLDFGGSLGSSYFQCREFLQGLSQVRWSVIEQPKHVACGRAEFEDEVLRFYHTIDECFEHEQPDVLLISCCLQYLKEPYVVLKDLVGRDIPYIVLDRTALIKGNSDRLTIETVPASIYPAIYPAWFFSERKLLSVFEGSYMPVSDFVGFDSVWYQLDGAEIHFKGFIFQRNPNLQARHACAIEIKQHPVLLNVGCGMRIHPDWINIDITSTLPGVIAHDISVSLPLDTNSCDAVYHSAVLEHLRLGDVERFMYECYRVLRPGGIIRVEVPDLEKIAGLYLQKLQDAVDGVPGTEADYDWMMLELYDQTVRERSGGGMLKFLAADPMPNEAFVFERIGVEGEEIVRAIRQNPQAVEKAARAPAPRALSIGKFRISGEVHQWMYDRFSLGRLLRQAGFAEIRVVSPTESRIPNWSQYHLDLTPDGKVIKPDLFLMEALKPV